jgi:DNA-binding transcriptional ArsR family regulator
MADHQPLVFKRSKPPGTLSAPKRDSYPVKGLDCIAALKALGEENRLRILRLLSTKQFGVGEISDRLDLSSYNVSKHLRILREAGLVEGEKRGQQRRYGLTSALREQLKANQNVLDLGCCTFRFDQLPK